MLTQTETLPTLSLTYSFVCVCVCVPLVPMSPFTPFSPSSPWSPSGPGGPEATFVRRKSLLKLTDSHICGLKSNKTRKTDNLTKNKRENCQNKMKLNCI